MLLGVLKKCLNDPLKPDKEAKLAPGSVKADWITCYTHYKTCSCMKKTWFNEENVKDTSVTPADDPKDSDVYSATYF